MTEPITARQFHFSDGVGDWRVAAAVAAGGRVVSDEMAPSGWVLADPEGNEACVAPGSAPTPRLPLASGSSPH